jgi:hypothetical protein
VLDPVSISPVRSLVDYFTVRTSTYCTSRIFSLVNECQLPAFSVFFKDGHPSRTNFRRSDDGGESRGVLQILGRWCELPSRVEPLHVLTRKDTFEMFPAYVSLSCQRKLPKMSPDSLMKVFNWKRRTEVSSRS